MPAFDSTARKQAPPEPLFRTAPHNIEAEQALLGAILVNNEAFYRVSDFLEPKHFFEPIHQRIYELAGGLVRANKLATPVTLEDISARRRRYCRPVGQPISGAARRRSDHHHQCAGLRPHHLRPLDPPRSDHRSARTWSISPMTRRSNSTPMHHIEDAERKLYEIAETGRYDSGFQRFAQALTTAVDMAARAYQRDGSLSGLATGLTDLDARMGGLQQSDLIILAGRPGMGKTALATNIAYNVAKAYVPETRADGQTASRQRRHRRLLLARNVGRTACHPYHCRTDRHSVEQDPPRRHRRRRLREDQRRLDRIAEPAVLRRRDRRPFDRAIGGARAAAQTPARARSSWSSTTCSF